MKTKHNRHHATLFAALLASACPALAESPAPAANEIRLGNATVTVSDSTGGQAPTKDIDVKALLKTLNIEKLLENVKLDEDKIEIGPIVNEHVKIVIVGPDGKVKEIDGDAATKAVDVKALLKSLNIEKLLENVKLDEDKIEIGPIVKMHAKIVIVGPDGKVKEIDGEAATKDIDVSALLKSLNLKKLLENAKLGEDKTDTGTHIKMETQIVMVGPDGKVKQIDGDDTQDIDVKALLKTLNIEKLVEDAKANEAKANAAPTTK